MKNTHSSSWRNKLAALGASTILASGIAMPSMASDTDDSATKTPIKHVVIIFQENRSFDHYFGTYPHAANLPGEPAFAAREDTPAVNNLLSAGLLAHNPNLFNPFRLDRSEAFTCSMDHNYTDEQKSVDGGLMDKFVQATSRENSLGCRLDGSSVMAYFDGNTVTALWNYAQHFAMNDDSFDTTFGPSTPGVVNLVSGQTGNAEVALTFKGGKVATFTPVTITGDNDPALDDCGVDKGGTVANKSTLELEGQNIGDLLNAKGISWGWFQGGFAPTSPAVVNPDGSTATPAVCGQALPGHPGVPNPSVLDGNTASPPADIHGPVTSYNSHHEGFMYYASTRNQHHLRPASVAEIGHNGPANHNYDITDFFAALQAHNLPAVSYLKAPNQQDDHPGNSDPLSAQTFEVDVINALQRSDEWKETAVIIEWDDSDGWYDHLTGPLVNQSANSSGTDNSFVNANDSYIPVLPLSTSTTPANPKAIPTSGICGVPGGGVGGVEAPRCGYGIRLPFMVISPWSKRNFVDHTTTDQTSSLGFIEFNWGLGSVDGTPTPVSQGGSFDEITGSILNMFDFDGEPHLQPVILNDSTGLVVGDDDDHDRR